jgi:murein DD-endopeptidase MepM/ murein hydrolase activator NlpD
MLKRALAFTALFILVTSYTPNIAFSDSEYYSVEGSAMMLPSTIIADDSGFIMPVNPQTNEADRSGMTDKAIHTVQSGETLSTIAELYGIKTATLLWENGLSQTSVLKGQSLEKIAILYTVDKALIMTQNALIDETLAPGQEIFIPGGKQIVTAPIYDTPAYRSSTIARVESGTRTALDGTTATPDVGKFLIYPTRGKITQGYRKGHLAVDIADPSKPPIWAGAAGTVIKASSGTWGGGYGNHVIIDHGNGTQTLYAHMDYLQVTEGQYVNQGEPIGRMGNTGRVYGRTGIHLHFEVRVNGVKVVPSDYY